MNAITGLLLLALLGADGAPSRTELSPPDKWELTLSDAIRIGLSNADGVRVVCERIEEDGQTYVTIASADRAINPCPFKTETTALVRAIEQQYWYLVQHHAQLRAGECAVETARAVLRQEQADFQHGRGTVADVAEAEQRLEQFLLDVTTKHSDVSTTERTLRRIVGLPPDDNRRIVPVTAPVESLVEPDWDDCLAKMIGAQPRIAEQRMMVCASGLQYLVARGPSALVATLGLGPDNGLRSTDVQQARSSLERQQALLQQVVHQSTHSLARFFLEVDANYKQFRSAARVRAAAKQRMDAQRPFYDEGRIPIDRYLDAVGQHAIALAQEAQFRTAYNVSLLALEEAKGTLLEARQVTLHDSTPPTERAPQVADATSPERTKDSEVTQTGAEANSKPTSSQNVTFDIVIGEALPIRVRGTISITPGEGARQVRETR